MQASTSTGWTSISCTPAQVFGNGQLFYGTNPNPQDSVDQGESIFTCGG